MGLVNRPNKVPQFQRQYQAAYRAHTRLWMINPRSKYLWYPYQLILWGGFAASMYGMGRKIYGKNTWFSD
ncbi:hypothetical protein B0J18DRAFT_425839 [Chaetomium sp. MPI-SDFR-AT-0129]|uniref:Uncharacterized protein n=1 Tax=Dichotomopilus funicola TaxID=1934379 RepID=A0AAN6VB52_9PEZI|nr:hypothetical protein B0J18DRAFT_425839 [Chaetomium sp. MPI-SDFR-AT-0129]KAK4148213.1 hypothetical protein C8A04DRAFT_24012 [Dichotomopilus funicola]